MIVKFYSVSESISKLESIGFAYGLLVARGKKKSMMTPRVDPKQLELLLAEKEIKRHFKRKHFCWLFAGRH